MKLSLLYAPLLFLALLIYWAIWEVMSRDIERQFAPLPLRRHHPRR